MIEDRRKNENPTSGAAESAPDEGVDTQADVDGAVVTDTNEESLVGEVGTGAEATDVAAAEFEALRAEMDALNDRHLRLAAEFDNYRKRNERERVELGARAQAELVGKLLEALDDLQRVVEVDAESTSVEALLEGVELVEKKLRRTLESAGLEPIDAEGEFFNPATMEALMTLPAERPEDDELVADVFQKGYRFRDTLIRPARVRVRKYEPEE